MISPEIHLIIHNVVVVFSTIILLGVSIFVYLRGRKEEANIAGSLSVFFIAVFFTSHVIGINISDPELSRKVLTLNILMIFIGTFNLHAIIALFNRVKEKKWTIIIAHLSALLVTVFFLIYPDLFLLDSVPKMYFPNYYNPGILNLVRMIFLFVIMVPLCFYELYTVYKSTTDAVIRMQVKYFGLSMIAGYVVGFIPNLLVYDIKVDPLLGAPTAIIFAIPFVYGIIQYKMFNIIIVAKKAIYYALFVALIGFGIALLNYSTNWIRHLYPGFPLWTIYLFSAFLVVFISTFIWNKLKETDQLKYEFISTITHKLRTPMTGIRWATENLGSFGLSNEAKIQIDYIKNENSKLIELTNLLIGVSRAENNYYEYHLDQFDLTKTVNEVVKSLELEIKERKVDLVMNNVKEVLAIFDENRMKFVIQVLIENAIRYSPVNSKIKIDLLNEHKKVICRVEDFGIGMSKADLSKLFNKFYRSEQATSLDTEGLGIGLYISKEIIFRQNGKIWAESKGEGKGSIFYFSLPAA
jgi:signal transduction histidine kinase